MSNLELIAVHNDTELYKQSPNHEDEEYGLHRVPTFVFERNGEEIARIVEKPVTSLTTDIGQIAAGFAPKNSYAGVSILQDFFEVVSVDSLESIPKEIFNEVYREVIFVGELTTFAKKLDTEGKATHAEFVYKMNTKIFKYHPYPYYRLGRFYFEQGQYELAKEAFYKTAEIEPDYQNKCQYIVDLKEKLTEQ